jgi:hypothetical protein
MKNNDCKTLKELYRNHQTHIIIGFIEKEASVKELQAIIEKCSDQIKNLNTAEKLGFKREEADYSGVYFLGMDLGTWSDYVPHEQ